MKTTRPAKITIVLTHVQLPVGKELIVGRKTMLQFVGVHEATQAIPFRLVEDSQKTKSVKHVVPIRIVRLGKMTLLYASVNKTMSATHCKAVGVNANRQETAHLLRNVNGSNAYLSVGKACVERMLTAKPEIIVPNVLALLIFLEMDLPDVTQNVPNMTIAREIRLA